MYSVIYIGMNKEVHNYIVRDLLKSNAFYWVNGTPEKRLMRIKEYAWHQVTNMPVEQFERYLKKIEIENKNKN